MAIKKTELINSNHYWKENIKSWQFYMDSYVGAKEYKDGEYLSNYLYESREEYEDRLDNTAIDNHVRAVASIYNSFLFRQPPQRDFATMQSDVTLPFFMDDADLDGRSFDHIMRDVSTYATVYGHAWVILDKPDSAAQTRAQELDQGIRPYMSIYTPENVLDWEYARAPNGKYYLTYLKVYEGEQSGRDVFREYTMQTIRVYSIGSGDEDAFVDMEINNELGEVPAICVYSQRSNIRGVGISDVGDVASMQRAIYNEMSELEQIIKVSNHPSLVKTPGVQAHAGAGSLINVPEDTPEGLRPYLLQPNGANIESLLKSINQKVEAIDRMSHMGGIRSIESRRLSGVALATEFQLLNARLAEKADNLEHAEEQIWRLYAKWQGTVWSGTIKYPDSFNIQDKYNDMNMLKLAKDAGIEDPLLKKEVEDQMLRIITTEERYNSIKENPPLDAMVHMPVNSPEDLVSHLRDMVAVGYTNQQILELHPELETLFFGDTNGNQNTIS